jgi:hypothetical protein
MAVNLYRSGGFATDDVTQFINLWAGVGTSNAFSTFRKVGASSGYAVTAGKQFYICQILMTYGDEAGSNMTVAFGYNDNDLGMNTTAPTRSNPVPLLGDPESTSQPSAGGIAWDGSGANVTADNFKAFSNIIWKGAPAGKYMHCRALAVGSSSGLQIAITGFEV